MKKLSASSIALLTMAMPMTAIASEQYVGESDGIKPFKYNDEKLPFHLKEDASGKGVKVGIIDSGISPHEDLNIVGGYNFIDNNEDYTDEHNHGTMVSGILNSKTFGVAPNAELYGLKVLDSDNTGFDSDIIEAIEWSIENEMDIINISIIVTSPSEFLIEAIEDAVNAGIIVVACAGNSGKEVTAPANLDGVISVGSLESDLLTKSTFSSDIGKVDYYAKGNSIYSTNRFGGYESNWKGTSFASPYVAGMFALYKESFPDKNVEELKEIVFENSRLTEGYTSYRVINEPTYYKYNFLEFNPKSKNFNVQKKTYYFPLDKLAS